MEVKFLVFMIYSKKNRNRYPDN